MVLTTVKPETLKKLKGVGFNIRVCTCGGFPECICTDNDLPTLALVQMWLREKHNIFVDTGVDCTSKPKFCYAIYKYNSEKIEWLNCMKQRVYSDLFRNYEQALEAGILEAIELIK